MVTSTESLLTFGDGTFGALGHGDHESVAYPKEVQSLRGLKSISVSCGAWHTAAIIEATSHPGVSTSSRKLFTWGNGDKNRLGHGNKDAYLVPTCVSAFIDYNIQQLACGHNITVALLLQAMSLLWEVLNMVSLVIYNQMESGLDWYKTH